MPVEQRERAQQRRRREADLPARQYQLHRQTDGERQRNPQRPPTRQTNTASIRNCCNTSPERAPTAMRMPISRVRSVTDTSMMFITPIPPTTSEITATSVRNSCSVRVVFLGGLHQAVHVIGEEVLLAVAQRQQARQLLFRFPCCRSRRGCER